MIIFPTESLAPTKLSTNSISVSALCDTRGWLPITGLPENALKAGDVVLVQVPYQLEFDDKGISWSLPEACGNGELSISEQPEWVTMSNTGELVIAPTSCKQAGFHTFYITQRHA